MQSRNGHKGHNLETLILASQTDVRLTKVPQAAGYGHATDEHGRGLTLVRRKGPCDFFGGHVPSGQLLVFDAKQSQNANRLDTSPGHLAEHQRLELCRYGDGGFIAGLLCECTATSELYWCDWRLIRVRVPSVAWADMAAIGSSKFAVKWDRLIAAACQAEDFALDRAMQPP